MLQTALTLALIVFSRGQNRQLAISEIDRELATAAWGLKPLVERWMDPEVDPTDQQKLEALVRNFASQTEIRVTVVDADGVVLADSEIEAASMENHLQRPEVVQAIAAGIGRSTRRSGSTKQEYSYLALALDRGESVGGYLRTAMATGTDSTKVERTFVDICSFCPGNDGLTSLALIAVAHTTVSPLRELSQFARSIAKGTTRSV